MAAVATFNANLVPHLSGSRAACTGSTLKPAPPKRLGTTQSDELNPRHRDSLLDAQQSGVGPSAH